MKVPGFVADFDSATGLVRALAATLHDRPHLRLGRSRSAAAVVQASRLLPEQVRTKAFAVAGGREAVKPRTLLRVDPEAIGRWVVDQYGADPVPAVAIGSSNGAMMHLCAAVGMPWLPQTFLAPVRRNGSPDDCRSDVSLAADEVEALLKRQRTLQVHQMHDPNQDRLMVTRLAYFRMKLRGLPQAYHDYLRAVLRPAGTIVIVDCQQRWPVHQVGDRHAFQLGAVGGLAPEEYTEGSPRVEQFLARERASVRRWDYPDVDGSAPEAEWGYEPALTDDIVAFADAEGFRVVHLEFPHPESLSPLVADLHLDWYRNDERPRHRLLAETFICVEPTWTQRSRSVPFWMTFATEPSLAQLESYLGQCGSAYDDLTVTLFPHGVRSAGYAPSEDWLRLGERHRLPTTLAGVVPAQWPADFATLVNYSRALYRNAPVEAPLPPLPLSVVEQTIQERGERCGVRWETRLPCRS